MAEAEIGGFISGISEAYQKFIGALPPRMQLWANLFLLTIIVVIYAIFIWKFYTFISTKNILKLDLYKYNKVSHPTLTKIVAGLLYFVEYIIILPLLVFFWFALFTVLLVLITKGLEPKSIILISAITIAAIRVTSYLPHFGEKLSGEIAKIVPLTLLVIGLTDPLFFNLAEVSNKILKIQPALLEIWPYLFFIISLEILLRGVEFILELFTPDTPEEEEKHLKERATSDINF